MTKGVSLLKKLVNFSVLPLPVKISRVNLHEASRLPTSCYRNAMSVSLKLPKLMSYSTLKHEATDTENLDDKNLNSSDSTLTLDLINHLERTSLVEFGNEEALIRLSEAINFANVLLEVDTTGVEPMVSVLDKSSLLLRDDKEAVTSRDDILMNSELIVEDFFVSPPGNIPLSPKAESDFVLNKSALKKRA